MNDSANRFWKFQGPGILTGKNSRFARLDDEVQIEAAKVRFGIAFQMI